MQTAEQQRHHQRRDPDQARAITVMGVRQHAADEGIGEQRRRCRAGEDAQIGERFAAPAEQDGGQEQQHGGKRDRLVDAVDR